MVCTITLIPRGLALELLEREVEVFVYLVAVTVFPQK